MAYRRGFKTEAHALAVEVRAELDLNPLDRLDPFKLADHLEIPVLPLTALREKNPDCVRHFTQLEPEAFSGVTVFSGQRRMIVYNELSEQGIGVRNLADPIKVDSSNPEDPSWAAR